MPRILGVSCSLRNARFGYGSDALVTELHQLPDKDALQKYLEDQSKARLDAFEKAGRTDGLPFDEIYRNLRRAKTDRGLSNSEAALAAGLWGALQEGAEIVHCGLSRYFPMNGSAQDLDDLREKICESDALLVSGPIYFGDRGSLAQEFFEFIRDDPDCRQHVRDRLYAGIAVGAKRNGGQETTLIYQMLDMINLNALAVGNDSETTSQYGGTAKAGDVGTLFEDDYGIQTSIGTGRRIARVAGILERGDAGKLEGPTRIAVWLLQDSASHQGRDIIQRLCRETESQVPEVRFDIHDFTESEIWRCIACDVCPVEPGPPADYRCIIKAPNDAFRTHHQTLIDTDAVLVAAYSPSDRHDLNSAYQRFIERTRYLRRDDYLIGDRLSAPLVISGLSARQNLHIRMTTSMVRHHQILHHPLIGMEGDDGILNWDALLDQAVSFARNAQRVTIGRLSAPSHENTYNPVGYYISAAKVRHDQIVGKSQAATDEREKVQAVERKRVKA